MWIEIERCELFIIFWNISVKGVLKFEINLFRFILKIIKYFVVFLWNFVF